MIDILLLTGLGLLIVLVAILAVLVRNLLRRIDRMERASLRPAQDPVVPAAAALVPLAPEFEPLRQGQTAILAEAQALQRLLHEQARRIEQHETALESFAGMLEDQHGLLERLDERSLVVASRIESIPSASAHPKSAPTAAEVARSYMSAEGYADVAVFEGETTPQGFRLAVRGLKGQELRAGWVTIRDGRVTEARLTVPTSLFP